jgi:mRNA interferase MazF
MWLADLDKRRPVVVLTRDPLGGHLRSVIVGPVTSMIRGLSTEVELGTDDGAPIPSVVTLDNLLLLDRRRLVRRVGRVRAETLRRICSAAAVAIGCT